MRLACTMSLLLLAGCPPKRTGTDTGGTPTAGAGCPAATDVYVASYLTPEEGGKGHTGWVLPLFDKVVQNLPGGPEYTNLSAADANTVGVPAPPQTLWLLTPGAAPCKATLGQYYVAQIDSPTLNLAYGVELSGCAAPPDPQNASAIVVVSEQSPGGCQIIGPRAVAQRLGEVESPGSTGKQNKWQRPTKQTPVPPALAAVIPRHDCTPPGCEPVWSFAQIDIGGAPVAWAGAINWLEASDPDPCNWKGERFSGFFVAGADGTPVKVTEGQDHPLALTAVLGDKGGAKVVVAEGPGEYATYTLGGGKATVAHHLVWLLPHPDSYEGIDHLGPVCNGTEGP